MFTSFFGTTMTFLIVLPAMIRLNFFIRQRQRLQFRRRRRQRAL